MALWAVGLGDVLVPGVASTDILLPCHRFQMAEGIDTAGVSTQMIKIQTLRDRTHEVLV